MVTKASGTDELRPDLDGMAQAFALRRRAFCDYIDVEGLGDNLSFH